MANKVKSLLGGPGFLRGPSPVRPGGGRGRLLSAVWGTGPDGSAHRPGHGASDRWRTCRTRPVVETVPPEEPEEETEPVVMPEVTIPVDDTPVVAEEPHVVVLPIQGEVLTAFSVDQLLYNETLDDWRTHDGVDIAAAEGDAVLGRLRRDGLLHHRRSPDGHHRGDPAQRRL